MLCLVLKDLRRGSPDRNAFRLNPELELASRATEVAARLCLNAQRMQIESELVAFDNLCDSKNRDSASDIIQQWIFQNKRKWEVQIVKR